MNLNPTDYLAIVAGLATIISICINIIQWRDRKSFATTLKSRSQAAFNYFFRIAIHADRIRGLKTNQEDSMQLLFEAKQQAHSINGLSDAARYDICSYSREHLNFVRVCEHPSKPFDEELPKPIKNKKRVHNLALERDREKPVDI